MEKDPRFKKIIEILSKQVETEDFWEFLIQIQLDEIVAKLNPNFQQFTFETINRGGVLQSLAIRLVSDLAEKHNDRAQKPKKSLGLDGLIEQYWQNKKRRQSFIQALTKACLALPREISFSMGISKQIKNKSIKDINYKLNNNFEIRGLNNEACGFREISGYGINYLYEETELKPGEFLAITGTFKGYLNEEEKLPLEKQITLIIMLMYILELFEINSLNIREVGNILYKNDGDSKKNILLSPELSFAKESFSLKNNWDKVENDLTNLIKNKRVVTYTSVFKQIESYFEKKNSCNEKELENFEVFESLLVLFSFAIGNRQNNIRYIMICSILENLSKISKEDYNDNNRVKQMNFPIILSHKIGTTLENKKEYKQIFQEIFNKRNMFTHEASGHNIKVGEYKKAIEITKELLKDYFYELTVLKTKIWM